MNTLRNSALSGVFVLALVMICSLSFMTGCSHRTVTTDSTVTTQPAVVHSDPVVVHEDNQGVLGATLNAVGEIIAFPFKLIGSLFSAIF